MNQSVDDRPASSPESRSEGRRTRLAAYYALGSGLLVLLAWRAGVAGAWMLWPAAALGLVAANYAFLGVTGFAKRADGRMCVANRILLTPYILGARINSRLWTRRNPDPVQVADDVWLGRFPSKPETLEFKSVVDVTAELPAPDPACDWRSVPMLDLVTPAPAKLAEAADAIRDSEAPTLVCCALGFGRSAAVLATWLLRSDQAQSLDAAVDRLRQARPEIVLHGADLAAIDAAAKL